MRHFYWNYLINAIVGDSKQRRRHEFEFFIAQWAVIWLLVAVLYEAYWSGRNDKEKLFSQSFRLILFIVNKIVQLKLWSAQQNGGVWENMKKSKDLL